MSIDLLAPLVSTSSASLSASTATSKTAGPGEGFMRWMADEAQALNERIGGAEQSLVELASGQNSNLHQVMLDLEQAKLSFQLALQVRNRLLEGYQEIMRMQI
jgi:flagellar hook-basal body complex protein FliE